jgi:hypothetical protein
LIETWVACKRENEVGPIRLRPHPHEFELCYDIECEYRPGSVAWKAGGRDR